jgi:DNA-binding winged helix-turn-helix (wHTH) protein
MPDTSVQFGAFNFFPSTGKLTRRGEPIALEHQPALLLEALLASPGRLVTRDELTALIWKDGTHVKFDAGLNYCIRQVRAALGDDPKSPTFIETVPRRGYRFIARVSPAPVTGRRRWRPLAAAAILAAGVALTAAVESRPNNHHQMAVSMAHIIHNLIF